MECQGEARTDISFSPSPDATAGLLSQFAGSTCGSAGVDICTAATVILDSCKVHKVPLDAFGPLDEGKSALLMGRSSATLQGITVHLGLIDADYMGQICAMVSTPTPLSLSLRRCESLNLCFLTLLFPGLRTGGKEMAALDLPGRPNSLDCNPD